MIQPLKQPKTFKKQGIKEAFPLDIKKLGEFGLINRLTEKMREYNGSVLLGIGDDAAAVKIDKDSNLLAASDMFVEGSHFLLSMLSPRQLGHKALAAGISDIAAMGGIPRFTLISAGWPSYVDLGFTEEVYRGFQALASRFEVQVIGGDTVKSPQIILDIIVLGEVKGAPVTRGGAKPGDLIAVTGRLGASGAGLNLLKEPAANSLLIPPEIRESLIKAHLEPYPRVEAAAVLRLGRSLNAMIDISDGLASEINHICESSGTGALLHADKLPVDAETRDAARALKLSWLDLALYGGEDYELLVTMSKAAFTGAKEALMLRGIELTEIGEILPTEEGILIETNDGVFPLAGRGFNHFR